VREVCLHVEGKIEVMALLEELASEALDWVAEMAIDEYEGKIPDFWEKSDAQYIARDMYERIQRRLMTDGSSVTPESNVRKVIAADLAFDRWRAEQTTGRAGWGDGSHPAVVIDEGDHWAFRAGYNACLRDQAEAQAPDTGCRADPIYGCSCKIPGSAEARAVNGEDGGG